MGFLTLPPMVLHSKATNSSDLHGEKIMNAEIATIFRLPGHDDIDPAGELRVTFCRPEMVPSGKFGGEEAKSMLLHQLEEVHWDHLGP